MSATSFILVINLDEKEARVRGNSLKDKICEEAIIIDRSATGGRADDPKTSTLFSSNPQIRHFNPIVFVPSNTVFLNFQFILFSPQRLKLI